MLDREIEVLCGEYVGFILAFLYETTSFQSCKGLLDMFAIGIFVKRTTSLQSRKGLNPNEAHSTRAFSTAMSSGAKVCTEAFMV